MKWLEEYSTGVEAIDTQHKLMFKLAEDFREALDEGRGEQVYATLLDALDLYVRTHFGYEEECMARHVCPVAQINQEAHVRFIAFLDRYAQRYATAGFVRTDARDLVDTIDLWLVNHITRIDVRLREALPPP